MVHGYLLTGLAGKEDALVPRAFHHYREMANNILMPACESLRTAQLRPARVEGTRQAPRDVISAYCRTRRLRLSTPISSHRHLDRPAGWRTAAGKGKGEEA